VAPRYGRARFAAAAAAAMQQGTCTACHTASRDLGAKVAL
jgi:cytochrome c551/c552